MFSGCCSGCLLVAVALVLVLFLCGGSPLVLPLVLFRFVGVQLKEEKGTDPRTGSNPKITF